MLDGVLTTGLLRGLPLLAEVQIRWKFLPQSMGDCAVAVLIGVSCLVCDWFFYQRRTGGKFLAWPDWTKLLQWQFRLPALLQTTCLLAIIFLLARFYFYSVVNQEPGWRNQGFGPEYPRLDPNTFFWAGIAITACMAWQLYDARASSWRFACLGVIAGLLVACRWLHPGGALAITVLAAGALLVGKRFTTLAVLVVALYLSPLSRFPSLNRHRTPELRWAAPPWNRIPPKRRIYHADIHTWLVLAAITIPALSRAGLRYRLDVVILAMLAQQAAYFSREVVSHYNERYDEYREYHLDSGMPVPERYR